MAKQPTDSTIQNSGKHLYSRGWLGLIPIVGAFAGFVLLLLGLIKYRDKKLVLIGFAGILFTVTIYGSLFYYTEYSQTGRKQFAEIAQQQVNDLIKNIEFYKLQNGKYPDSLSQLTLNNKLAWIYDPLAKNRSDKFRYQKIDNHYILFSVGIDRTANTKDDIYPTIDTSKTGLLKVSR